MLFDIFEIREKRLQNRLCAAPLASLSGKAVRFDQVVEKDRMVDQVLEMLK